MDAKAKGAPSQTADSKSNLKDFLSLLQAHCQMLAKLDLKVEASTPAAQKAFCLLPIASQTEILTKLRASNDFIISAIDSGVDLRKSKQALRHALKVIGLKIDDDLFDNLNDDDVIEAYSSEMVQIFRTFNFFKLCNYSLAELLVFPWYELYERNDLINSLIMEEIQIVNGGTERIIESKIPAHVMKEKQTPCYGIFEIQFRYWIPLYTKPNTVGGFILVQRARTLEKFEHDQKQPPTVTLLSPS